MIWSVQHFGLEIIRMLLCFATGFRPFQHAGAAFKKNRPNIVFLILLHNILAHLAKFLIFFPLDSSGYARSHALAADSFHSAFHPARKGSSLHS